MNFQLDYQEQKEDGNYQSSSSYHCRPKDIKRIRREYYEQLYIEIYDNLDEMDYSFERFKLS